MYVLVSEQFYYLKNSYNLDRKLELRCNIKIRIICFISFSCEIKSSITVPNNKWTIVCSEWKLGT